MKGKGRKKAEKYLPHMFLEQRQDAARQEADLYFRSLQLSQLGVNLPIMHLPRNLIMSFRRLNVLKIMLPPIRMPTTHSHIPKHAGNESVFCSTVTAQIKPWEEIVGPNVTARPRLKAKSGRSCTTLWWKRPIICVGLICANKRHGLEFPTDQARIHFKNRELVKDLCSGTSPQAP